MLTILLLLTILQEPVKQIPRGENLPMQQPTTNQSPAPRDSMSSVGFPNPYTGPSFRTIIPNDRPVFGSMPIFAPRGSFYNYNNYYNSMELFRLLQLHGGFHPLYFYRYERNDEPLLNKDTLTSALRDIKFNAQLLNSYIAYLCTIDKNSHAWITTITVSRATIKRIKKDKFIDYIDIGQGKNQESNLLVLTQDVLEKIEVLSQTPEKISVAMFKTPSIRETINRIDSILGKMKSTTLH